jgi:hypothetical protein
MSNLTGRGVTPKTTATERKEDDKFLKWLRTQPCAICKARPPSQACHIRLGGVGGIACKPIFSACPMCASCHKMQHDKGHEVFGGKDFWLELKEYYLKKYRN